MYKHEMKTAVVHQRAYKVHKERLRSVRGIVDCGPPFHNPHVYLKLKKMEYDERKNVDIDNANKNLLRRLQKVLENDGSLNRKNLITKGPTTMNRLPREQRLERIKRDNFFIARRIENMQPYYQARKWEDEFKRMKYLQGLWSTNNNEAYNIYNPTPRTNRSMMSLTMVSTRESRDFKPEPKHKEEEEDDYEDDFEEGDETKRGKNTDKDTDKEGERFAKGSLPPIAGKPKKSKKHENGSDTRRSKVGSNESTRAKKKAEPSRESKTTKTPPDNTKTTKTPPDNTKTTKKAESEKDNTKTTKKAESEKDTTKSTKKTEPEKDTTKTTKKAESDKETPTKKKAEGHDTTGSKEEAEYTGRKSAFKSPYTDYAN